MRLPPSGLAGILLLLFVAHALSASLIKTPTYDEPAHIGAGLSYLRTRDFKVNLQHPPLLKELAALPLLVAGVRWPVSAEAWAALGPLAPPALSVAARQRGALRQRPRARAVLVAACRCCCSRRCSAGCCGRGGGRCWGPPPA